MQESGVIALACAGEQPVSCIRQAERVVGHVGDWQILSEQPALHLLELVFRPSQISYSGARLAELPSNAGRITQEGRQTDTDNGCLFYGPYVPVPPGTYRLQVYGTSGSISHARIDVVYQRGTTVLAEHPRPSKATGVLLPEAMVTVPEGGHDLEIRLCVSKGDVLKAHGYSFRRVEP